MGTAQIEQNAAQTETEQEQRYKYIVQGETFYFTREEIKARILRVEEYRSLSDTVLNKAISERIKDILRYNGDPYGYCKGGALYELLHEADAEGKAIIMY